MVPLFDIKCLWISLFKQDSTKNLSSTGLFEEWYSETSSENNGTKSEEDLPSFFSLMYRAVDQQSFW